MTILIGKYETHPAADLFPLMDDEALKALAADIKAHGLRDPVVIHDGAILDGRNRTKACALAGIEPRFVEWLELLELAGDEDENPSVVEWVLSRNLHRRHLDPSQMSMVAADSLPLLEAEAKERQVASQAKPGEDASARANLPTRSEDTGRARDKAAKAAGVSPRSVANAAKVKAKGTEELQAAVRSGAVSVSAAAAVADEPKEVQRALVAAGPAAVKKAAKDKRTKSKSSKEKSSKEKLPELNSVERFVLRVREIASGSAKTAEHVRVELRSALEAMDSAQ